MTDPYIQYECKQLKQLIGGKIVGIIRNEPSERNFQTSSFGFEVRLPDNTNRLVWVDADPEGNGPGHLNIEQSPSA